MNILVTGGAGFIGKHLVEFLLKNEHNVTIFDNFSNSEERSVIPLVNMGAKLIRGNIMDLQNITDAIKGHDIVIHLAAKISVEESIKNPAETFHTNVDGTRNVLSACKKNYIKKLVVASSAAVYGEGSPKIKLTESSKISPISPYGESKALMEQEVKKFVSNHRINYVILRFFNIYGTGQSPEYAGVITKFIRNITTNRPLEIFGDGMQTRDFVAIQDVVDSIYCAISNGRSGIYNIASGKSVTIKKLAEFMIHMSGKNLKIQYNNTKNGDIKHSQADISMAKKELQYIPKLGLEEIKNILE